MPMPPLARCLASGAALFAFVGCNEDRTAEIEELNDQLSEVRKDLDYHEKRSTELREKLKESQNEVAGLNAELRAARNDLRKAMHDLEGYRRKEEAVQQAEAEKPDAGELRESAKQDALEARDRMVDIVGDRRTGVGILVTEGGKTWIYCGREIIEGNNQLEIATKGGTSLKRFGAFEVARGASLVRLEVVEDGVEGVAPAGAGSKIERSTTVLCFAAGGDLVEGRASLDNDGLRIDRRIADCPAGSPVFHADTGELIGVVVATSGDEPTLWPDLDRGQVNGMVRLDGRTDWSAIPIGTFLKEARVLADADEMTRLVHAFAATHISAGGIVYGSLPGRASPEEVFAEHKTNSVVKSLGDFGPWLEENASRMSEADLGKRIRGVYESAQRLAQSQSNELSRTSFSPANAAAAVRSRKWREEANASLAKRLAALDD